MHEKMKAIYINNLCFNLLDDFQFIISLCVPRVRFVKICDDYKRLLRRYFTL